MIVAGVVAVCLLISVQVPEVKADYVFEVQVDSYQNPTGQCLECQETPSAPGGCCDDFRDFDCPSFTDDFCDTYFTFCLREFGTPSTDDTFCPLGRRETPLFFRNVGTELFTFQPGETALFGLPNPLPFTVSGDWPGRVELLLVVMDSDPPFARRGLDNDADDVVDRFRLQRNLTIGTEFTAPQQFDSNFTSISLRFRVMCADGFEGMNCEIDLDPCGHTSPCLNGATCNNTEPDQFECLCADGFEGMNCGLLEIDECSPNPCQRGSCNDLLADFSCSCVPGFTGRNCGSEINECDPNPCQNGGKCEDLLADFNCSCAPGFTGRNCENMTDDCDPNPCLNGGTCEDLLADFNCSCAPGFTGRNCENMTDDCDPNPCLNGGTCEDLLADFNCSCAPGFTGRNCEDNIDDCVGTPCGENGQCEDGVGSFTCVCDPGHTGQLCDQTIAGGGGSGQPEQDASSGGSSDTGAIVGGVIGGLLFALLLIAIAVVLVVVVVMKQKKQKATISGEPIGPGDNPTYGVGAVIPQPANGHSGQQNRTTHTGTSASTEREFDNPLYESGAIENEYSVPESSQDPGDMENPYLMPVSSNAGAENVYSEPEPGHFYATLEPGNRICEPAQPASRSSVAV